MFKKLCNKIGVADYRRFRWATWILLFSMGGLAVAINNRDTFFPKEVVSDIDYLYRLLWVLPFAFIGFSCLAFVVSITHDAHDKIKAKAGELLGKDFGPGSAIDDVFEKFRSHRPDLI